MRVTALSMLPGYPIRKSSDHSSVDSSPRHIAASHVLHRLLVPRHPPCALTNLATKMLASTVQFSKNGRPQPTPQTHPPGQSLEEPVRTAANPRTSPTGETRGSMATEEAPAPSGPNSAPHEPPPQPAGPFHPPKRSTSHQPATQAALEVSVPRQ